MRCLWGPSFISDNNDERGNYVVPSKVGGGLAQISGAAGRFYGNPMSGNQTCKRPPISNFTLKELQWRNLPELIPTMNLFL